MKRRMKQKRVKKPKITPQQRINLALIEIVKSLHEVLTQPYINYDIDFNGKSYSFGPPLDQEHAKKLQDSRNNLVIDMLSEALSDCIDTTVFNLPSSNLDYAWDTISRLLGTKIDIKQVQSPIASSVYKVARNSSGGSIPMNEDGYYIKNDRRIK